MTTVWDFEQIKWISSLLQWLIVGGCALFTYLMRRDSANEKDVQKLAERINGLETKLEAMPSAQAVHDLAGDIKGMRATMEAMQRSVDRMNDFLMQSK